MENNALKRVKVASAFATRNEKLLIYDQIPSLNWKHHNLSEKHFSYSWLELPDHMTCSIY